MIRPPSVSEVLSRHPTGLTPSFCRWLDHFLCRYRYADYVLQVGGSEGLLGGLLEYFPDAEVVAVNCSRLSGDRLRPYRLETPKDWQLFTAEWTGRFGVAMGVGLPVALLKTVLRLGGLLVAQDGEGEGLRTEALADGSVGWWLRA